MKEDVDLETKADEHFKRRQKENATMRKENKTLKSISGPTWNSDKKKGKTRKNKGWKNVRDPNGRFKKPTR